MQTLRSARVSLFLAILATGTALADQDPTTQPAAPGQRTGKEAAAPAGVKPGQDAPAFELADCHGKTEKLSDYKDKTVVLVWVNQKCPFSDGAVPALKELHKKYADQGVVWLAIDSTPDRKPEDNVEYVKRREFPVPILMDSDGKVGHLYGARTTPHVFLVNKGKLAYMGALHTDPNLKVADSEVRGYLDEALAAVLAGKTVPLAETKSWGCPVHYREEKK